MPEQVDTTNPLLIALSKAITRFNHDVVPVPDRVLDREVAEQLVLVYDMVVRDQRHNNDREIVNAIMNIADINRAWRYMNRNTSQEGLINRLDRRRLPLIRAKLKAMLDANAAVLIRRFPLEEMPVEGMTLDDRRSLPRIPTRTRNSAPAPVRVPAEQDDHEDDED